jgi:hypothetical protein
MNTIKKYANVIIFALVVILIAIIYFQNNKIKNLKNDNTIETNLNNALLDSVHHYYNSNNELVAEKLTLQTDLNNLKKINNDLYLKIQEINKKNEVIAAALIEANIIIEKLKHGGNTVIDTVNNSVIFSDSTKNLEYKLTVSNIQPIDTPTLFFNYLYLPNEQFIAFHWGEKKDGYPISFSVTNSNKYYSVSDINSYIIPEIQKPITKPSTWQKIVKIAKKTGQFIIVGATGVVIGAIFL